MLGIGLLASAAQPCVSQEGTVLASGGLGTLSAKDEKLADRLLGLLVRESTRDRRAGWRLAADLGPSAVPLLWRHFELEKDENRLVLLAAAMIAGGDKEDDLWFAWLAQNKKKPMLRERALMAMLLALGPMRSRPVADFWERCFGVAKDAKDQERLLTIAVRLAAARFQGTVDGMLASGDEDAGSAAAAAWAGLPVMPSITTKYWNSAGDGDHAALFWRGAMLGAIRQSPRGHIPQELVDRAQRLLQSPLGAVATTSTWLLANAGALRTDGPRPEAPLLRIAVGDLATAASMHQWLAPERQLRDDEPHRLAVAYALSRPPQVVIDQRARWPGDPALQRHIAVAVAWQLLGGKDGLTSGTEVVMPELPEWNFVRAAAGLAIDRDAICGDPRLQSALVLLGQGRIDRRALRLALEEALWRWGSHPRRVPYELERQFLRDVMLAGSNPGGARYQASVPANQRYFPTGLDRDDPFFRVATAVYDFLMTPSDVPSTPTATPPLPAEHRMPG